MQVPVRLHKQRGSTARKCDQTTGADTCDAIALLRIARFPAASPAEGLGLTGLMDNLPHLAHDSRATEHGDCDKIVSDPVRAFLEARGRPHID